MPDHAHPRLTGSVGSLWRCGDLHGAYPIFSGMGAAMFPGRWNTAASPIIYASETFFTALLEKLVHLNGLLPPGMHAVEILVPDGMSIEYVDVLALPGWITNDRLTKSFGDTWFSEVRTLLLRVPSVPAAAVDYNVLINPTHRDFARLVTKTPIPVHWDQRLFFPLATARS